MTLKTGDEFDFPAFIAAVNDYLRRNGYNKTDLADLTGSNVRDVRRILNGERDPGLGYVCRLARFADLSLDTYIKDGICGVSELKN